MLIIKPDAFERRVAAQILEKYERCGAILRAYTGVMTKENCLVHYEAHIGKPFFNALCEHMMSGHSMFVEVDLHWKYARQMAEIIRAQYGTEGPRNLIHASDSQEANIRETDYWFKGYGHVCKSGGREVLPESPVRGTELGSAISRQAGVALQEVRCDLENCSNCATPSGDRGEVPVGTDGGSGDSQREAVQSHGVHPQVDEAHSDPD